MRRQSSIKIKQFFLKNFCDILWILKLRRKMAVLWIQKELFHYTSKCNPCSRSRDATITRILEKTEHPLQCYTHLICIIIISNDTYLAYKF